MVNSLYGINILKMELLECLIKKSDTINIILLREKTNTRFAWNRGFFLFFYE